MTSKRAGDDRFCEVCDVSLDLHPYGDKTTRPEDWECASADNKARLIESFSGGAWRG